MVRAIRLRAGRSYLEHAIQNLYPMELSCDQGEKSTKKGEERPILLQVRENLVPQEEWKLQLQTRSTALHK